MTKAKIEERISRVIQLQRLQSELEAEIKEHKTALIAQAESDEEKQTPTEGGGWSWVHQDSIGNAVRVTQPAPKLKGKIDGESKTLIGIRDAAGTSFKHLFEQIPAYRPVNDFREKAIAYLGRGAGKVIKLATTESAIQVGFEVKEVS